MNMTYVILALTGAYALVAAMLAYLLLLSRLHWVFKLLATATTVAAIPLTFWGVGELRGMPSDGEIPPSFRMLWAEVTEPNPLQGEKGRVFLWLHRLDDENYPVGLPRAYQLPYSEELHAKVNEVMVRITEGEQIQGHVDTEEALPEGTSEALAQEIDAEISAAPPNGGSGTGERISDFDPAMLTFGTAEAPITPTKPQ